MKVDGRTEAGSARPAPDKARFQQALHRALPPKAPPRPSPAAAARAPPSLGAAPALARGAVGRPLAGAEHLGQVRQGLNAEAHRLADVRGEAHASQHERVHQRVKELIARELLREEPRVSAPERHGDTPREDSPARELSPEGSRAVSLEGPGGTRPAGDGPATPEARVQATLELIERLELFVKSHRPALALQLGGGWDARVEVERTGVGEVALRIQGRRGPLPAREVERLREALQARGLQLSALHNG